MQKLIRDTEAAAAKLFNGMPIRLWYFKFGEAAWKSMIINTDNKIRLLVGPKRTTPESSLQAVLKQLENIVGKQKAFQMSVKYKGEVGDVVCLECDKPTDIELFAKKHTFEYGGEHTGVKAIEMSCIIPIHRCCT